MRFKTHKIVVISLFVILIIAGCVKYDSYYYEDKETPGVAIFSNTGNNVFSCFINGIPWKTISIRYGGFGFGGTLDEIEITKDNFDSLTDRLSIRWSGNFNNVTDITGHVTLNISVAKNFTIADFRALQGKRLEIDGNTNYFETEITSYRGRGSGSIYFNTIKYDSILPNQIQGSFSGLLEADFATYKLTSGRFDHNLEEGMINFY